jgi:hypothetical protein
VQVEKDIYSFNTETGQNDIQEIKNATPREHEIVWICPDQATPFGSE